MGLVQRLELCRNEIIRDPGAAKRRLDELQALAKSAVADVRRMSNDLRPLILEDLGLPVAVQTLVEDLGGDLPAARVACRVVGNERRLPAVAELTIFRVAQEALSNIRKHARSANKVDIRLETASSRSDWRCVTTAPASNRATPRPGCGKGTWVWWGWSNGPSWPAGC